jgi:hypothetical protein
MRRLNIILARTPGKLQHATGDHLLDTKIRGRDQVAEIHWHRHKNTARRENQRNQWCAIYRS